MKILITHYSNLNGGAEEVVAQLQRYLNTNGHSCRVVQEGTLKRLRYHAKSLEDWADVINAHNFPAPLINIPTKKPIVWYCNEPPELFTNLARKPIEWVNRQWVKKSGMKVVVADKFNADRFEKLYKVPPSIIPYGIDYEFWFGGSRLAGIKGTFTLRDSRDKQLRLLQVGTVTSYKNQLESIATFFKLYEEGIDVTLTLVGGLVDRKYYSILKESINSYELSANSKGYTVKDRIKFLGQMSKEEIRHLYWDSDILLHPVTGQGGWLVPFEAMCLGLPVITIPQFSASSLIMNNLLGVVTSDMAESILQGEWIGISAEYSNKWVKENLTWEKFGEAVVKVFEEALYERC